MDDITPYLSKTNGILVKPNEPAENEVVFLTWLVCGLQAQNKLTSKMRCIAASHLGLNIDSQGRYKPKTSHDNITYSLVLKNALEGKIRANMDLSVIAKEVGWFRVWDLILYKYLSLTGVKKTLFTPLLIIPLVQTMVAFMSEGKTRPKFHTRWKWLFKRKELVGIGMDGNVEVRTYEDRAGNELNLRTMQNDGKHLGIFKLFTLQKHSFMVQLLVRYIFEPYLVRKYGKEYVLEIIVNYFNKLDHPVISYWVGVENYLTRS